MGQSQRQSVERTEVQTGPWCVCVLPVPDWSPCFLYRWGFLLRCSLLPELGIDAACRAEGVLRIWTQEDVWQQLGVREQFCAQSTEIPVKLSTASHRANLLHCLYKSKWLTGSFSFTEAWKIVHIPDRQATGGDSGRCDDWKQNQRHRTLAQYYVMWLVGYIQTEECTACKIRLSYFRVKYYCLW